MLPVFFRYEDAKGKRLIAVFKRKSCCSKHFNFRNISIHLLVLCNKIQYEPRFSTIF